MNNNPITPKTITVGGQAVIEGVMMRSADAVATAVRKPNGQIVIRREPFTSLLHRYRFLNIPILRGSIAIIEMLIIGTSALQYSADVSMSNDEEGATPKKSSRLELFLTTAFALGIGVLVFFAGPISLTNYFIGADQNAWSFNLVAGTLRAAMFITYVWAISQMKDIFRLFQYHGAEHVSIYAFENKDALIPENGLKYDTPHPRCGTSFLMFVMIASILSFAIIDSLYIAYIGPLGLWNRLALHLPCVPIVAGLSYELIKLSGKYYHLSWARIFMMPGLWLQRITTKKPDITHIEVAMAALQSALGEEAVRAYNAGQVTGAMSVHE